MFKPRARLWLVLLVTALAAFALRIFRIESQSLWYDEAFSVYLARMDLGAITARTAADIQPPLYYYLLHFWIALTGDGEFSLRFLSLLSGVLTVPLLYVVARRLFGLPAGLLAALLALVSPLYLWYSQEARMYTLITFLGLLSSYALLRASQPPPQPPLRKLGDSRSSPSLGSGDLRPANRGGRRERWWAVFAVANIAAVYTHYFAFAILAFQFLYWLGTAIQNSRQARNLDAGPRPALGGYRAPLVAFGAILLAFLPWVPFVLNRLGEDASYWRGALKVDEAIRHVFINFTLGESVLEDTARVLAGGWMIVLLVGLAAWLIWRRGRSGETGAGLSFSILYLVVPLALLLFLFSRNPKFNARYLMIASPGLLLLVAAGMASLVTLARSSRPAGRVLSGLAAAAGALLLFGTAAYADSNAYFSPDFTKADFRGVARYVAEHANADEAIVLVSGHLFPAFDYYYRDGSLPELRLPDDATLNAEHVLNFSAADELNRGVAGKRGVWLVSWQDQVADPNGFVPLLLSTRGDEQKLDASFWQVSLRHWTLPADAHFSNRPELAVTRDANFKNKARLLGLSQPAPAPADRGASFNLFWQALDNLTEDYQVSLRVIDAQGNLWGKQDRRPSGYYYPTMRWKKDETLFGSYSVPLLPGAPAGDYLVTATLFTASDQTGLDVLAANGAPLGRTVKLGPVRVLPAEKQPKITDLNIQHTLSLRAGPLTLLGYNLTRESASTGESIPLTLFWRADQAPGADYTFQVRFGDQASAAYPLANAPQRTSYWSAGEIVRGQYLVQVPPGASAGATNLQIVLAGPEGRTLDLLQPFSIQKTDRVFVAPPAEHKQDANFNNVISLAGYNLSAPQVRAGDTLTVTLNWKALGKMDKPYTIFVHLLDKESKVGPQRDAQPLNGNRATPTWVEGEYLVDAFPLAVKPDTPPGEYTIEIGWYDAADPSFARLQVIDANGGGAGDRVLLEQKVTLVGSQ